MAGIPKGVGETTLSHKNMSIDFKPHENYIILKHASRELINPMTRRALESTNPALTEGHPVRRA
jgi:hypothetical protein